MSTDVVVVGGGIGGASLAYALARAGKGVTVLEATTEYADRVRGESMQTWGVAEARRLGVEPALLEVQAAAFAEDAPNRAARRAVYGQAMDTMDPDIFPVMVAAFAGPETVPDELVNPAIVDRIRNAA